MQPTIPLNELPRLLRQRGVIVSYPKVWRAAVEGEIPTIRKGQRWHIDPANLDAIAAHYTPADV